MPEDKYLLVEACPGDFVESLFVDRLKIVDVAELEEYTSGSLRQGERTAVTQSDNHTLSPNSSLPGSLAPSLSTFLTGYSVFRLI